MKLISTSFQDGGIIPDDFAFCIPDDRGHVRFGSNQNPHLRWDDAPNGTKSFAIICHDPDVPSKGDDVNQEGKIVPASLPRVDFFHWIVLNLPADMTEIKAGSFSKEVTPRGKSGPTAPFGGFSGLNDYTAWFVSDPDMQGQYYGYDGPCPPWNDSIWHRYIFTVYALDIDKLPLQGSIDGKAALAALQGHILGKAEITGKYSLNPALS